MRPSATRAHLRVAAGQAGDAVARPSIGEHAGDLRFLAAHHLGRAGLVGVGQAGHQQHVRAVERHRHQRGGELGRRRRGRADRAPRPSPGGCRSCRPAARGVSPSASQSPALARSASANRPSSTCRMPRGASRRSSTAPSASSRKARKLLVPQSTPIMFAPPRRTVEPASARLRNPRSGNFCLRSPASRSTPPPWTGVALTHFAVFHLAEMTRAFSRFLPDVGAVLRPIRSVCV